MEGGRKKQVARIHKRERASGRSYTSCLSIIQAQNAPMLARPYSWVLDRGKRGRKREGSSSKHDPMRHDMT